MRGLLAGLCLEEGERLVVTTTLKVVSELRVYGLGQLCGEPDDVLRNALKRLKVPFCVPVIPFPVGDCRQPGAKCGY